MKKLLSFTLLAFVTASLAFAQPTESELPPPPPKPEQTAANRPHPPGPMHHRRGMQLRDLDRLVKPLELTEDQVAQLREVLFESGKGRLTNQGKAKVLEFTIQAMMMEQSPNLQELREVHEELSRVKSAMSWTELESQLQIKKILTEEQQRKMRMMEKRGPRMRRRGRAMHRPEGAPPPPPQDV